MGLVNLQGSGSGCLEGARLVLQQVARGEIGREGDELVSDFVENETKRYFD